MEQEADEEQLRAGVSVHVAILNSEIITNERWLTRGAFGGRFANAGNVCLTNV